MANFRLALLKKVLLIKKRVVPEHLIKSSLNCSYKNQFCIVVVVTVGAKPLLLSHPVKKFQNLKSKTESRLQKDRKKNYTIRLIFENDFSDLLHILSIMRFCGCQYHFDYIQLKNFRSLRKRFNSNTEPAS